jgi:hypothetical protein
LSLALGGYCLSTILDAGVSLAVFVIALIFAILLFIEYIRKPEQDRAILFTALFMLIMFALAYLSIGLRPLLVLPDATYIMLQGWAVQWGIFMGLGGFFMVFWAIRLYNKEFFSGRSSWGILIPIFGLAGYGALLWFAALTHPNLVIHGYVTWIAPNLTTWYGIGFTVLAIACAVCYLCLVPLVSLWLRMRTRRGLGKTVFMKDMMMWIGLLLIFVSVLADFLLLFVSPLILPVVAVRAIAVVGFLLLWFGYRLANLFLK